MASAAASPAGAKAATIPPTTTSSPQPLIPISLVDAPTQRLWAAGFAGAVQAYKLYILFSSQDSSATLSYTLLIDFALVLALSRLRIPRLSFTDGKWLLLGVMAGLINWMLVGGWRILSSLLGMGALSSWAAALFSDVFAQPLTLSEHRVRIRDLINPSSHLLGQHTIHVLPYSTATFASSVSSCHCIGPGRPEVNIPVIFNNTEPHVLQYSVISFEDSTSSKLYNVTIPKGSLTIIANDRREEAIESAEWDEVEAELIGSGTLARRDASSKGPSPRSARTKEGRKKAAKALSPHNQQRVYQLPLKHEGRIRLERVLDRSGMDARIAQGEVMIVGCPTTSFVDSNLGPGPQHKCPGEQGQLDVSVHGLAPLELSYRKQWTAGRSGAKTASQTLSISHISNTRIASPLVGGEGSSTEDALSFVLGRRRGPETQQLRSQDFTWALAQDEVVSISLDLKQTGSYVYELHEVKDACGNAVEIGPASKLGPAQISSSSGRKALPDVMSRSPIIHRRQVEVHSRAHASILGCSVEKPLQLLRGGQPKSIRLKATPLEPNVDWKASVRFQPEDASSADPWTTNVTFGKDGSASVQAAQPGLYILDGMDGTYCSGEVGSPWSCPAVEVPPPTADISFSAIEDVCAGSVGVNAMAVLSGQPPFRLQYEIKRKGVPARRQERVIERTREEFEFRPSTEGAIEYRFIGLADANYRDIALDGPVFEQIVHPLASAYFVPAGNAAGPRGRRSDNSIAKDKRLIMRSCEGSRARAEIMVEGAGPFDVTYVVRSGSSKADTAQRTITGLKGPKHTLEIDLPSHINTHGGTLTVSLVSIRDGKNCERPLTTSDVIIEIRRGRPSAAFVVPGASRGESQSGQTQVLDGREAHLPIRLEGEAPWKVEYLREGDSMPVVTTIRESESYLVVDRPGSYSLTAVHDAFCEGSIPAESAHWHVTVAKRPSVRFSEDFGVKSSKNGSLIRQAICRGTPDSVMLELSGQAPLEVTYEHRAPSWSALPDQDRFLENDGLAHQTGVRDRETFTTAQNVTAFQLSTSTPGWHTYELLEVGDTVYPVGPLKSSDPLKDGLRLEQMVHGRPSASFAPRQNTKGKSKKSFCFGDSLHSQPDSAPAVQLAGQPPFTLTFELQSSSPRARTASRRFTRTNITTHTTTLGLEAEEAESFTFDATGQWGFHILSLEDGNGCITTNTPGFGQVALGGADRSAVSHIEVVDTASIAAVGTRVDYCVGETVDYILQGTAPWTVSYAFNGHVSSATINTPSFSRVAEKAGVLEVLSVAHQQSRCKRELSGSEEGMRKVIHPLPSVKVRDGGHFIEDLREGAQTEIVFVLKGTPPFSLTYQRLEAADVYEYPRVLEEHTVAGILEEEMRISASEEGTWRVIWLQDRFCGVSYPAQSH